MQQRQQQQKQQLRQPHTGTTYRGRRAEKWQWTVELLNSMMHQRVSEKTSGEWEGCVIWREGLLQRLRVCVCVSIFFCLFVSDGRCLMVIESILFLKPSQVSLLIFSPQYVEWFFQCWARKHLILAANRKTWYRRSSSKQVTLSDSFIVFFNLFVLHIFSFVIWICRFSSQIHCGAIAGHCWYPVSSSSVCSKGGWSLEQILALPGRWAVLCHCTLPWENKMDMDGYAWKWRDLDTSNHWFVQRTALALCGSIHVWGHGFPSSFNSLVVSYAARGRRRIERPHHLKMMRVMFLAFRKKPSKIYVGLVSWCGVYVGL